MAAASSRRTKAAKPRKGDVLWCIEGEGSPKKYRLATRGVVTRLTKHSDGTSIVHYMGPVRFERIDVTGLPWFRKLFRDQGSFGFGLNAIGDSKIVAELEGQIAVKLDMDAAYTDLCAYTLKHSSSFDEFAAGQSHTIDTKGRSWAKIASILADRRDGEIVPVLFAPAEHFGRVTASADLVAVKTMKNDSVNSFTFSNFRLLSPPLLKSSLKWYNGNPLGDYQREYAICRTPADLAQRLIIPTASEAADIAAIEKDPAISDATTRKALVDARRGQGAFRTQLDGRWDEACAVTKCSVRDLLRASHIKPWRVSSHQERLDPQNGILLSANIDILFDKGFLSFDDNGHMLVSARLSASDQRHLGLPKNLIRKPDPGECAYLKHHRKAFKL